MVWNFQTLQREWSVPASCFRSKVRWDRRASVARGAAPCSEQSDAKQPGHSNVRAVCFRRTHDTGAALYRSAPFVPKGLFYVNRSVYLFSLNHFNAFICWVELKRILDCHKRSGIIPAICHSFFHCCHCRISGSHQIPVISFPILPDRCSFRNFGLNLFYEHPSKGVLSFYTLSHFLGL